MAGDERLSDFEKAIRGIGQVEEERTRNFMESNFPIPMRDRQPVRDVADFYNRRAAEGRAAGAARRGARSEMAAAIGVSEEELDDLLGGAFAEEDEVPEYLGYPALKPRSPRHPSEGWTPYVAGDEFDILQRLPTEGLRRYQDRMVALGLVDSVTPGFIDANTIGGFKKLLEFSNQNGMQWAAALRELETLDEQGLLGDMDGSSGSGPAPFVVEPYLPPDYDAIEDNVYNLMRDQLGRDPDESELAILASSFAGMHREAFDKNVEAERMNYEAQVAASEGAEGQGGGTVEGALDGADLAGKFRQLFRERFSAEIQGNVDQAESGEQEDLVQGAVSTLSRMTGGMG